MAESPQVSPAIERVTSRAVLGDAWRRVRRNRSSPGIDRVTVETYERELDRRLQSLTARLRCGSYRPKPALRTRMSDGREIAIPTVEDRIVQRAVAAVLSSCLRSDFSTASFAYRPGRSVADALKVAEQHLAAGRSFYGRTDIEKFFDRLDRRTLLDRLVEEGVEPGLLGLVEKLLRAQVLEGAAVFDPGEGASQGSALSPLLSDIYLRPLDQAVTGARFAYLRYADDILLLAQTEEEVADGIQLVGDQLDKVGLKLNARKTRRGHTGAGFSFLGVRFDASGRGFSKRAVAALAERVAALATSSATREAIDLVRAWSRWYGNLRPADVDTLSLLHTVVRATLADGRREDLAPLAQRRLQLEIGAPLATDAHADLAAAWVDVTDEAGERAAVLDAMMAARDGSPATLDRLATILAVPREVATQLRGTLRDVSAALGACGRTVLAAAARRLERPAGKPAAPEIAWTEPDIERILRRFAGRAGVHALERKDHRGHLVLETIQAPLTEVDIRHHLENRTRLGVFPVREDGAVEFAFFETRVRRDRFMTSVLSPESSSDAIRLGWQERLATLLGLAHDDAVAITRAAERLDFRGHIEDNGYDGRRVWFFFAEPVQARHARALLLRVEGEASAPAPDLARRRFPHDDDVRRVMGPPVLLPFATDARTGRRGGFVDASGRAIELREALAAIRPASRRQVLHHVRVGTVGSLGAKAPRAGPGRAQALPDGLAALPKVTAVLSGCRILGAIVDKSRRLGHVDGLEKASLIEVLAHVPDEGRRGLSAIYNLLAADPAELARRLRQVTTHPVGCGKIRKRHAALAMEAKCKCHFRGLRNGAYPTPILFALRPHEVAAWQNVYRKPQVAQPAVGQPSDSAPTVTVEPTPEVVSQPSPTAVATTAPTEGEFEALIQRLVAGRRRPAGDEEVQLALAELTKLFARLGRNEVLISTGKLLFTPGNPPQLLILV